MKFLRILFFIIPLSLQGVSAFSPATENPETNSCFSLSSLKNDDVYAILQLANRGLSYRAFDLALKGMKQLYEEGHLAKTNVISIADFSQSSKRKRLYVIDLENQKILFQTYVAHGRNSGEEFARSFSNKPQSYKTSLGFYTTIDTYDGENGLSLRLKGEEPGINDHAFDRAIVIHGANYVCSHFIQQTGRLGRSQGCPAIPQGECESIINTLKDGSCLFLYYPDVNYLRSSKLLI